MTDDPSLTAPLLDEAPDAIKKWVAENGGTLTSDNGTWRINGKPVIEGMPWPNAVFEPFYGGGDQHG